MNSTPRSQARNLLLQFYNSERERLGRAPSAAEFFPVNVNGILRTLGWIVRAIEDMTERGAEILGKVDPAHKIVYLDNKTRDDRQRYTLAHEIGHIVLHADRGCDMMFRPQDPRAILRPTRPTIPDSTVARTEREANTFAAELLMPEKTVLHEFERRFKTPRMWVQSKDAFQIAGLMSPSAKDTAQKLALHSSASAIPLKDFFGVSSPAMERRILELGLVY